MDELTRPSQNAMALFWILCGLAAIDALKIVIEPLPKGKLKKAFNFKSPAK